MQTLTKIITEWIMSEKNAPVKVDRIMCACWFQLESIISRWRLRDWGKWWWCTLIMIYCTYAWLKRLFLNDRFLVDHYRSLFILSVMFSWVLFSFTFVLISPDMKHWNENWTARFFIQLDAYFVWFCSYLIELFQICLKKKGESFCNIRAIWESLNYDYCHL